MSLDLGAVVGHVLLDTSMFDRKYPVLVRMFAELGGKAAESAGGVRDLDAGLGAIGAAADKASGGLNRTKDTLTRTGAAQEKAATSAKALADGQTRLAAIMADVAGQDAKVQQATLRQAAAQERANLAAGEGNAAFARLAASQATLIGAARSATRAQEDVATATRATGRAQEESAVAGAKFSDSLKSGLKMAGQLGLLVGAFEVVKKAIDISKQAQAFQRSMLLIHTQADATMAQVKAFSGVVLQMSGPLATAPDQLALSLYHAFSVTKQYTQSLNIMKIAAEGAQVGNADLEETTNALTSTVASGIKGVQNMQQAMGALNSIVGAGDMKLSDLNEALGGGILAIAREYGVSLTQVGAALATFGDLNVRGADAATKLRMSIMDLAKPAAKADNYLVQIGLSSDKLRKALAEGGLTGALDLLSKHMTAAGITAGKVGPFLTDVFTKRAGAGLAVLIGQMDRYHQKLLDVSHGAQSFGEEWQKTTQTASFQMAALWARIEAGGIVIAEKLNPAVATAAHWLGTSVPHAIGVLANILGPTVHLIGVGLVGAWHGLDAILGPVTTALGKVGHFLGDNSFGKGAVTSILALWAAFKGYQVAMLAVRGLMIMYGGIADKVRGAIAAVRSFGVAQSAAVAGFGGLIAVGVAVWQQMSDAAAKNAAAIRADVESITATLNKENGAITETTRNWVIHRLVQAGVYDLAAKMHVTFNDLTDAALGNKDAIDRVNTASKEYLNNGGALVNLDQLTIVGIKGIASSLGDAQKAWHQQHDAQAQARDAMQQYAASSRFASEATVTHTKATDYLDGALTESASAVRTTTTAVDKHATATQTDTTATMLLKQQTDLLKTALGGLANRLNNAAAAVAWQQSLNDLTSTIKTNKGAIDGHSDAALADRAALIGDMQTVIQHAQTMEKNGKTWEQVTGYISTQYGELRQHAVAAGADGKQVDALAKKLGVFPKSIQSRFKIDGIQTALNQLAQVRVAIQNLGNGNYRLSSQGSSVGASFAAGGTVPPNTTATVGEAGWELMRTDSAGRASIIPHGQSRAMTGLPARLPGYANGTGLMGYVTGAGFRGQSAQIMDAIDMAESGGNARAHNYNPSTGDDSYGLAQINLFGSLRSRLRQFGLSSPSALYDPATNMRVAYALSNGGRDFSPWSTYNSGAYLQFMGGDGTLSNASGGIGQVTKVKGGWQFGDTVYASQRAAENAARRAGSSSAQAAAQKAQQERQSARSAIHDVNQQSRGLGNDITINKHGQAVGNPETVKQFQSGWASLMKDLRGAGVDQQMVGSLEKFNHRLTAAIFARNVAAAGLIRANKALLAAEAKKRTDYASFKSAGAGIFDITSAGVDPVTGKVTAGSIEAEQRQDITRLRQWYSGLHDVASWLPATYFRQLEAKGPDALPELQAIRGMKGAARQTLIRQARQIAQMTNRGAAFGSSHLDQHQITIDRRAEHAAQQLERRREAAVRKENREFLDELKHVLSTTPITGELTFKDAHGNLYIATERSKATHNRIHRRPVNA